MNQRRTLPPLNALIAFEAAARHVSFTRAAQEMNVSQGAVSRHIARLEARLGVALFERVGREVRLTEQGGTYFREVERVLDELSVATQRLGIGRAAGHLRLHCQPTFSLRWLIPRLPDFHEKHQNVFIDLTTAAGAVDLEHTSLDLAIERGMDGRSEADVLTLFKEVMAPVAAPSLMAETNRIKMPEDLKSFVLLHTATRPRAWSDWFLEHDCSQVHQAEALNLDHFYLALQAAIAGLGIAIAPIPLVIDDLESGRLVIPIRKSLQSKFSYNLLVPRRLNARWDVTVFRDWLIQQAKATVKNSTKFV